jgi:hypothetical protein
VPVLAALVLLSACGSPAQINPNARPKTPLDLPLVSANLEVSGPVSGAVRQARLSECRKRPEPDGGFYASVYLEEQGTWYFLQLIAVSPIPVVGNRSGYSGPGTYHALVDFRDMKLYPAGMLNGDHAWGSPVERLATLTVAPDAHSVTVGSASGTPFEPVLSSDLILWPARTDQSGPPPSPRPSPDQIVTIRGSWSCV